MEQLLVIIQQIYQILNILNCYTQGEREELLEGYPRFLSQVKELLGNTRQNCRREHILGLED